jgi:pimeloyl-ACP methyl ester carboxylesterase
MKLTRKAFLSNLALTALILPSIAHAENVKAGQTHDNEGFKHHRQQLNGRQQHFVTMGSGPAVLFLHGFPDLWRGWRAQMKAVADAGYLAIAPDLRGYGETEGDENPELYTGLDVIGDLLSILDYLSVDKVTLVAHDWGTTAGWAAVQVRPDRFVGMLALSVPWLPRGDRSLPQILKSEAPKNYYLPWFLEKGPADNEFDRDPETFLRRIYFTNSAERKGDQPPAMTTLNGSLVAALDEPKGEMAFLPNAELQIYADSFRKTGSTSAFNAYRGLHRSWELMAPWNDMVPVTPVQTIVGTKDLVAAMPGMRDVFDAQVRWMPNARPTGWIEDCGHFPQMEKPAEVNSYLLRFLRDTGF